ncbi:hybrid sensor histidine kinase/response regulator [Enterovibrio norvegicus FF-33]|uniref:PAS domain S-box protein n=1 Tax=Enterovibrio TaxID=188143 RepID=UPI0002D4E775|nr:PAS domain S-box protein [Enterovibrio norvegicus]OEE68851.1 hybrid sensor histidine kinase/response regulator [Enterovibrio norvegicus FF-33]
MSIIESLSLFFLPSVTYQPLPHSFTGPWVLLLASVATFITATLAFLHRPLQTKRVALIRFSPILVNALTLTVGMALLPIATVLSVSSFQDQGFLPLLFVLPLALTFFLNVTALRMIAFTFNPPLKIFIAAGLMTLSLIVQNILVYAGINGVAIAHFDLAVFTMALGVGALLIAFALWFRFSKQKNMLWERDISGALASGLCVTIALLVSAILSCEAILLSAQPNRIDALPFAVRDVLMILIFSFTFVVMFSQLANTLFDVKAKANRLGESEKKLDAILHTATEAIISLDGKGTITFFNQAAENVFGWHASDATGKNIRILVTDEHQHRHDMYIHNFLENRESGVVGSVREVMAKHKDGSVFPVRLAIGYHQDAAGHHEFVGVLSDISEQRHLAWALRENAKQYRSLVANLPCMAFREMTGATRHMVYISDAAKSITGYSASILTGENGVSHFIDRIHQEDTANYRKARELAARRNGKYDCEYRFISRDEEEKWFWEIGHSYRAEDGSTWIDGVIIDITDKREAEEEFEEKIRLAEKASQSKASFLANMSYEFRSPMNSILGLTEVLIDEENNPVHRHHLEVIRESGNSLLKLINDILDTSKLESQSLPLDIGDFSLVQLCRQIEFIARETVQARDLHVTLDYSDHLWEHYVGDSRRIKQLLQNMMRSALTKTDKGNVALHVLPTDNMVRFAVASYSLENAHSLSKNNEKSSQTLSATLVTQLIELMNGKLWFDGESIHGSVIYADLPIIPTQSNAGLNSEPIRYALPPLEVLVIDDVQRNQQELRDMLLRQGVKVLTYTDIDSAQDVIKTQPVDVVLFDAYLDEQHYPTPKILREWSKQSGIESLNVIAMKLVVDPTTDADWEEKGFDAVIEKPFRSDAIFEVLKNCCGSDENDNNVAILNRVEQEKEKDYFNDSWAFRHWPTSEILLSVVGEYRANYANLPQRIEQLLHEQPEVLERLLAEAIDGAHHIGFQRVEQELTRLLAYIEGGDMGKAESNVQALEACFVATFERALAYLGVRAEELDKDLELVKLTPDAFARKAELFISRLSEGQFDDGLYKELVPALAAFVAPSLLAQFVGAIENFELDEAYDLILTMMNEMPTSQHSGVQSYGV